MNKIFKTLGILVVTATIFLSACTPPPPPVSKDQLNQAEQDMISAQKEAKKLKSERDKLQKQLNDEKAKLQKLQDYQKEMNLE